MFDNKIAVAMSVYYSDDPQHLDLALNSVFEQSYSNFDLYLYKDGVLTPDLELIIANYRDKFNFKVLESCVNKGLAARMNEIIECALQCNEYDFFARMDADDLCHPERFYEQVSFLSKNSNISVVGSDIEEMDNSGNVIFYKEMNSKHELMVKNIIKKCPFNHPSVMFRMNVFNSGVRYDSRLKNTQDYYLWVDLISMGFFFSNINKPLLKFRVNDSFHSRRGVKKALNDIKSRFYAMKKLKCFSLVNVTHTFALFLLRISPPSIKVFAYKHLR